ncbi:alpha-ribazole phosphatase [Leptospira interrogans]|uniref:Alpha-ribazole phosphatase n=3 Tax=Leptospira interrogans TaxID=173 RepID=A0A0E2D974_LEPIR|nr:MULTISPECIES: alpha-ribazole phosphatase [Leptospira]ASV07018.1 alpha-ribazole phosphatase [Leptospira interrogans serovar Canicola]EJO78734.1 alpha-ribazole phosphatase [Leptospira interrogans serovar Pomona str. Kennewicki LC82-25]EKN97840.1 alpha-ribazole phosphatase [Leptospira interrogans serovar Pomona str. Pomona]EKO69641.1 alpha-ribazole phosphatase [Leptospira interrogans serovar Canicola str. Fiocruz LV133]EKR35707.1 alpha-ribazole phosphatase [Leptospira interrogans serovar Hebdo
MELYLIRHTTPEIPKGICYGQTDIPLISDFNSEFQFLLQKINVVFDLIYSSPSSRCRKLSEFLNNQYLSKLEYSNLLMELNFGSWEGKPWSEIPKKEYSYWAKDFVNFKVPNGESYQGLYERVSKFLDKILHSFSDEKIGIVTHAGVIRTALCKLLNIPLERGFYFDLNYGSINKILIEKDGKDFFSKLIFWNL